MAFIVTMEASNTVDLIFDVSATNADSNSPTFGQAIDFTGAVVSFMAKDDNGFTWLIGSIGSYITQPSNTVLEFNFPKALMQNMCKGTYKIGCIYQIGGETDQLFSGTLSVYEGVATI